MSESRSASVEKDKHIGNLKKVCIGQFMFIVLMIMLCFYIGRTLRVYIPPNLNEGGFLDINYVPQTYVYEFSRKLWKKVMHWQENVEDDYIFNISKYQNYFTPACRKEMEAEYYKLMDDGEIQYRVREVVDVVGERFDSKRVDVVSKGQWNTTVQLRLMESLNNRPIKDITISVPLKIVYFNVDEELNPWGLGIDCYHDDIKLIKNNMETKQ